MKKNQFRSFSAFAIVSALLISVTLPARAVGVDAPISDAGLSPTQVEGLANNIGNFFDFNNEISNGLPDPDYESMNGVLTQLKGRNLNDPSLAPILKAVRSAAQSFINGRYVPTHHESANEALEFLSGKTGGTINRFAAEKAELLQSEFYSYLSEEQQAGVTKAKKFYEERLSASDKEKMAANLNKVAVALGGLSSAGLVADAVSVPEGNGKATPPGGQLTLPKNKDQAIVDFIKHEAPLIAKRKEIEEKRKSEAMAKETAAQRQREKEEAVRKHLDFALAQAGVKPEEVQGRKLVEDLLLKKGNKLILSPSWRRDNKYDYDQKWAVWTSKKGYMLHVFAGFSYSSQKEFKEQSIEEVDLPSGMAQADSRVASVPAPADKAHHLSQIGRSWLSTLQEVAEAADGLPPAARTSAQTDSRVASVPDAKAVAENSAKEPAPNLAKAKAARLSRFLLPVLFATVIGEAIIALAIAVGLLAAYPAVLMMIAIFLLGGGLSAFLL